MNASMKVLTPEQKWHAGRQADAFFGLLDQYQALRKALTRLEPKIKKQCAPSLT
jgi:hypothetical protein